MAILSFLKILIVTVVILKYIMKERFIRALKISILV